MILVIYSMIEERTSLIKELMRAMSELEETDYQRGLGLRLWNR